MSSSCLPIWVYGSLVYLLRIAMAHVVKGSMLFSMKNSLFEFNYLKLWQTLMYFNQIFHLPPSGLSDLRSHTTWYHCQRVRAPHWVVCNLINSMEVEGRVHRAPGTTPCNHTTSPRHHTTATTTKTPNPGSCGTMDLHLHVFVIVYLFICVEWNVSQSLFW